MRRLICKFFGHRWVEHFAHTDCGRCGQGKRDRLWELWEDGELKGVPVKYFKGEIPKQFLGS